MSQVLVTGGAGFIGSHLVEALLARGDSVRVLDNLSTGKRENVPEGVEFCKADIRCPIGELAGTFNGVETVYHFAANPSVKASVEDPREAHDVIAGGTLNMLLAAREYGVKRFVQASSCAVYGNSARSAAEESDYLWPDSPYGASKAAAELHCRAMAFDFDSVISLRLFNVWGERQEGGSIVPAIRRSKKSGEPLAVYGMLNERDFIHVDDAVNAAVQLSEKHDDIYGEVNIGSGERTQIAWLLQCAGVTCIAGHKRDFDPESCIANTKKLGNLLPGFFPSHTNLLKHLSSL